MPLNQTFGELISKFCSAQSIPVKPTYVLTYRGGIVIDNKLTAAESNIPPRALLILYSDDKNLITRLTRIPLTPHIYEYSRTSFFIHFCK